MRFILSMLLFGLFTWCAGLIWFVCTIPVTMTPPDVKADAMIVLTGGNGRVERGFEMLAEGAAPILFISGVGSKVTLPEMLAAHATPEIRQSIRNRGAMIVLGHRASTTRTNAREVAAFAKDRELHSLRLVTAHYHMTRSMLEFHHALPDVTLIADPVFPDGFRREALWDHKNTRRLLLSEYHKYFAARFRMMT
jgi:uncharacterized SAM-binding protein YcdF (DUF218 family)